MEDGCLEYPSILAGDTEERWRAQTEEHTNGRYLLHMTVLDSFESLDRKDGHLPTRVSVYASAGRV